MYQSIKDKIWKIISENGRGWSFSAKDFLPYFKRNDIDTALFHLEKEGKIRKLLRGIYDYPMYSEILHRNVSPDLDKVAAAIAKNMGRQIQPTGNAALNYLRLSTQIQAHCIYLWDGPGRIFEIGTQKIHFQNASRKDFTPKLIQSRMLVQALRTLGKLAEEEDMRAKIKAAFSYEQWEEIKIDTVLVPGRIHKMICCLAQ